MTVEIISRSISMKVWGKEGIKLATPKFISLYIYLVFIFQNVPLLFLMDNNNNNKALRTSKLVSVS